jgi:3'-phosphoadenosine 5'-phosphosulfate sulfotransferase (PAPS reductase)/FAD synthetase
MRHIILISGKDSAATAIVQQAYQPDIDYEYVYNPTQAELPEMYAWIDQMEVYLNRPIVRLGESLERIIEQEAMLPSPRVRFCTRRSKIEPFEQYIGSEPCTVYFGIRSDEQRIGYKPVNKNMQITPAYPLVQFGLGINDVWKLLEDRDLLPPAFFWSSLYEQVHVRCPNWCNNLLTPWQRQSLFSWRSRGNCYFCFFQRQYEWIGLFEHYPDLFWRAVEIEESTTSEVEWRDNRRSKMWTWRSDGSLRDLVQRADEIRQKRADAIYRTLAGKAQQRLFEDEDSTVDELNITSCGLFCKL